MFDGRPVYRFGGAGAVFADDGSVLARFTTEEALRVVAGLAPGHAATLRHDAHIEVPDQWTLQSRASFPLHRVALGDPASTYLYLSDRTGDLVMETTAFTLPLFYDVESAP